MRILILLLTLSYKDTGFGGKLHGQLDPEPAAVSGLGFNANPAAHQFNGFPDGWQSQTDTRKILLRIYTDERHKDPLLVFLGNSDAIVIDLYSAQILLYRC